MSETSDTDASVVAQGKVDGGKTVYRFARPSATLYWFLACFLQSRTPEIQN